MYAKEIYLRYKVATFRLSIDSICVDTWLYLGIILGNLIGAAIFWNIDKFLTSERSANEYTGNQKTSSYL